MKVRKQKLFGVDDNPNTNAPVNWTADPSELYISGFYSSALLLTRSVRNKTFGKGELVYPAVYLYRHYLELRLKNLVDQVGDLLQVGIDAPKASHSLKSIWESLKPFIWKVDIDFTEEVISLVDEMVSEIDEIDPTSTAFRYAFNTNGSPSLRADLKTIGIETLVEQMDDIHWALESLAFTVREKIRNKRTGNI